MSHRRPAVMLSAMAVLISRTVNAFAQDSQEVLGQALQAYTGSDAGSTGLTGGISAWGLLGGMLFSGVGFVAFVYGKKNAELRPMLIGIALLVYPYLVRGTLMIYLVGAGLSAALYFFRE
ncbi:MAG: hypothetical protein KC897_02865 [Candidatus Omnitrophica bacterium]|nr:hypothetical protein [Candidatus Omnitrophota bacterium]MCB9721915.1 hypothetical protein [Candidatus Omnitrophota bacterium]